MRILAEAKPLQGSISVLTIGRNDLFADFTDGHALLMKVVGHQCFTNADAAVLTVLRFKITVQAPVIVTSVAMAIAG